MRPRPSNRRPSSTAGFTIIEVMMAGAILVIGFMGMIQAVVIGTEMVATARRQTLAGQIMSHEIEKLRLKAWDELPADGSYTYATPGSDDSLKEFKDAIAASGLPPAAIAVSRVTTSVRPDLKEIAFTLVWTSNGAPVSKTSKGKGPDQEILAPNATPPRENVRKMAAYFAKNGLSQSLQR